MHSRQSMMMPPSGARAAKFLRGARSRYGFLIHHPQHVIVVGVIAIPVGNGGRRIDGNIGLEEDVNVSAETCFTGDRDNDTMRVAELKRAEARSFDAIPPLMNQPMMVPTEQHQVIE